MTTVFIYEKSKGANTDKHRFTLRDHPGRLIEMGSKSLRLGSQEISLYDPSNLTIVTCSQADWDLATRITDSGRIQRLSDVAEFSQGEVNETNARTRGDLTSDRQTGKLVRRGAGICLYAMRPESQGDKLYIDVKHFLQGRKPNTKFFHHRHDRVVLQESSPMNNFRRIIAAYLPKDEFYNHKINYCTSHKCSLDLSLLLTFLNSKLADWYFRLGSSNNSVSHYQLYNLPIPLIATEYSQDYYGRQEERKRYATASEALKKKDFGAAFKALEPAIEEPPFSKIVADMLIECVKQIRDIEESRGEIARVERSNLSDEAQGYQDLIDKLIFSMAGLTSMEAEELDKRLSEML
jgi:hypothetical protein